MLKSKLVISLSKNSFLAVKAIIFLIDLRIRDLKQNVKMSDQSTNQLIDVQNENLLVLVEIENLY